VFGLGVRTGSIPLTVNLGVNHTRLSYGSFILVPDEPLEPYESTTGLTLALGMGDLVGIGVGVKWFDVYFPSQNQVSGLVQFSSTAWDYGFYARSPFLPIGKQASAPPTGRLRFLGAISWSNNGDVKTESGALSPLFELRRESLGLEFDLLPATRLFPVSNPWMVRLLDDAHLVSVAAALGWQSDLVGDDDTDALRGLEVRVLDVFAIRTGHVKDDTNRIDGTSFGWGLSWFGYAGVDYAKVPQYTEVSKLAKWSFWLRVPFDFSLN
jgi:hypothetical protein